MTSPLTCRQHRSTNRYHNCPEPSAPDGLEQSLPSYAEYRTKFITRVFRSPKLGCYFLGLTIFVLGLFRDYLYTEALHDQPFYPSFHLPIPGIALLSIGNILVLSSMWALGVTGTYLGDYFGILMDAPVTGFPFNVTGAPMYWGSTCSFLGTALYHGKAAGVLLTVEVFFMYLIALQFEEYEPALVCPEGYC